jgi:C4-dicarboxylate transporter, DctM subunit
VRKQGFTDELIANTTNIKLIGKTPKEERPHFWRALWSSLPALLLPLLILGGIRFGWFTPTEAAAVAVIYALVVGGVIYRELTWKKLVTAFAESALMVGLIMLVLAAAQLYSWALTSGGVPQAAADAIFGITDNLVVLLLLVNVLLLIAGMFIEANAALIIITPILLPVLSSLGVDPVHLGVIIVVNLGIGLITPPVGIALMLSAEISRVTLVSAVRASWPFLLVGLIYLMLITYVPQISLWLPSVLLGE